MSKKDRSKEEQLSAKLDALIKSVQKSCEIQELTCTKITAISKVFERLSAGTEKSKKKPGEKGRKTSKFTGYMLFRTEQLKTLTKVGEKGEPLQGLTKKERRDLTDKAKSNKNDVVSHRWKQLTDKDKKVFGDRAKDLNKKALQEAKEGNEEGGSEKKKRTRSSKAGDSQVNKANVMAMLESAKDSDESSSEEDKEEEEEDEELNKKAESSKRTSVKKKEEKKKEEKKKDTGKKKAEDESSTESEGDEA
jgi:hypothetical protein